MATKPNTPSRRALLGAPVQPPCIKLPDAIALSNGATEAPPELVASLIEQLIGALDEQDGDLDLEPDGDEAGGDGLPGDPIDAEHVSPEWHSLPARDRREVGTQGRLLPGIWSAGDDIEQDDGQDSSGDEGEPDFGTPPKGSGPGCTISDADYGGEELGELDEGSFLAPPIYGIDQTKGPLNEVSACRDYQAALQLGVVAPPGGGHV